MLRTKKGGISLSVNVLVVVIISLVILVSGIALLYNLIDAGIDIKKDLDQRTKQQLERLLIDEQQTVALPLNSVTLLRGDAQVFGLGILNIGDKRNFQISITPFKYVDEFGEVRDLPVNLESWLLYNKANFEIEKDKYVMESILVQVPKTVQKGTYNFKLEVNKEGSLYGHVQRFYIIVK